MSDRSEDDFRRALASNPASGADWRALAEMNSAALSDLDINAMTVALATPMLSEEDQRHLHFALAKVLGDRGDAAAALRHSNLAEG